MKQTFVALLFSLAMVPQVAANAQSFTVVNSTENSNGSFNNMVFGDWNPYFPLPPLVNNFSQVGSTAVLGSSNLTQVATNSSVSVSAANINLGGNISSSGFYQAQMVGSSNGGQLGNVSSGASVSQTIQIIPPPGFNAATESLVLSGSVFTQSAGDGMADGTATVPGGVNVTTDNMGTIGTVTDVLAGVQYQYDAPAMRGLNRPFSVLVGAGNLTISCSGSASMPGTINSAQAPPLYTVNSSGTGAGTVGYTVRVVTTASLPPLNIITVISQ